MTKRKSTRGRVKHRALKKQTDKNDTFLNLIQRAIFGDVPPHYGDLARRCADMVLRFDTLEAKRAQLEKDKRISNAIMLWERKYHRRKFREIFGFTHEDILKIGKQYQHLDRGVYNYYRDLVAAEKEHESLSAVLGHTVSWAIRRRDMTGLRKMLDLIDCIISDKDFVLDRNRQLFLVLVGRDESGSIRKYSDFTQAELRKFLRCDGITIRRLAQEFGVSVPKARPGCPSKS